jgi:hypothetical protein
VDPWKGWHFPDYATEGKRLLRGFEEIPPGSAGIPWFA